MAIVVSARVPQLLPVLVRNPIVEETMVTVTKVTVPNHPLAEAD
jgi:hypothetical protein